jgi:hypothetical protein
LNVTKLNVSLQGYEIGLSGAIPEPSKWSEPAMDRGILEFVSLLSGLIFKYDGRVVHGAHPVFTPIILRQARQHAETRSRKPVTLVMSALWAKDYSRDSLDSMADVAELIITEQIGTGSADDPETRNQSLTAMRKVLIDSQNVMVLVGGKFHEGDGMRPGVGEEMDFARERNIPQYLVAGLGGFASELARDLLPASLHNSLTDEENLLLFSTRDVGASVGVIFNHLANSSRRV